MKSWKEFNQSLEEKKLDPVGQEDADIDNDGDVDSSDKYLHKRRKAMKIKEDVELWEIAPKFDQESLRESYRQGEIFNIGDVVENLNTGLVGKITRRGTNHIICVTENGLMFKSWLRDIKEYTEVKMDKLMRDKKHPNTLVGTKGLFKYVSMMTPGALGVNKRYVVKGGKAYK